MPFLNQWKGENDSRKYFMINLHERMLPTSAGVEPATSWSAVGRRIQLIYQGRFLVICKNRLRVAILTNIQTITSVRKQELNKTFLTVTYHSTTFKDSLLQQKRVHCTQKYQQLQVETFRNIKQKKKGNKKNAKLKYTIMHPAGQKRMDKWTSV